MPVENGVWPVSPCSTLMRATSMPRISWAIWAKVVSMPWPCECTPTRTSSPPSGVTRTVAWSKPGITGVPQAANTEVPCAACSV
ncbi:Uncharacterised protein [Bordetella pertussis]|nr:Uncharacterised protein [Bordetella pertussis]